MVLTFNRGEEAIKSVVVFDTEKTRGSVLERKFKERRTATQTYGGTAPLGCLAASVESANRGREGVVDRPSDRSASVRRVAASNLRSDFRALLSPCGHGVQRVNRLRGIGDVAASSGRKTT